MIFRWRRRAALPDAPAGTRIRPVNRRDLAAMKRITREAFDGVSLDQNVEARFGLLAGTDWAQRRCKYIERDVDYWPKSCFVAERDGVVVGYVTGATDRDTRSGHIRNLAVAPAAQGGGIGRALVEHVLAHFRRRGMRTARIETLAQNERCTAFYSRLGFTEVGRQVMYFKELD